MSTSYMTQTEYAEHRGISQPRVSKMISTGKLKGCIKIISGRKLIDRDKADAALSENLDRKYNPNRSPTKTKTKKEQLKTIREADLSLVSLHEAQTVKANYDAALKKLEYQVKKKELLPADEVKKVFADMVLSARGKILSIKGLLAPLLKEFIEDSENFGIAMDNVETALRDVLTEMADSEIKR